MSADRHLRFDEALIWVQRIADPDFDGWDDHLAWLERDSRNAAAFDRASLLIEDASESLVPHLSAPLAVNDDLPPRPARWIGRAAGGGAIAAALAAVIAYRATGPVVPATRIEATRPGETRTVTLPDGTTVTMNGATAIRFDPAVPRAVRLDRGEAFFTVAGRSGRHFRVYAGDRIIEDVATAFDVTRDADRIAVAVREGVVVFDPAGSGVRLRQGQALTVSGDTAAVRRIDPQAAGSWRDGRLIYRDASFGEIAMDLRNVLGVPVGVDSDLSDRRFSGVIVLTRDHDRLLRRVGGLLDVRVVRQERGWRLAGRDR